MMLLMKSSVATVEKVTARFTITLLGLQQTDAFQLYRLFD